MKQELAQLMNSSGSHKDLAAKYVAFILRGRVSRRARPHARPFYRKRRADGEL